MIVVGGIILAAVAAFVIAVNNLGDPAGPARAPATTSHHAATGSAPRGTVGAHTVASWPAGLSGWTVVLARTSDQATARAAARGLADSGLSVGVLDTSQHPLLKPGAWLVFSGRYPDQAQAQAQAGKLSASNHHASVVEVAAPGGI